MYCEYGGGSGTDVPEVIDATIYCKMMLWDCGEKQGYQVRRVTMGIHSLDL